MQMIRCAIVMLIIFSHLTPDLPHNNTNTCRNLYFLVDFLLLRWSPPFYNGQQINVHLLSVSVYLGVSVILCRNNNIAWPSKNNMRCAVHRIISPKPVELERGHLARGHLAAR